MVETNAALSFQDEELLKQWRWAGALAIPIALFAFVSAIHFELRIAQRPTFDVVSYLILSGLLIVTYVVMWARLSLFRLFASISVVTISTYYVLKLVYALFVDREDILVNLTGNLVWTPIVIIIAFFGPRLKHLTNVAIAFAAVVALISATYWLPNWLAGTDLGTAQVLLQTTLSMLFTICVIYSLAVTQRYYSDVEDVAARYHHLAFDDELTELKNKNFLEHRLAHFVTEADPFALALIDIDHFTKLSAQKGSHVADAVLKMVAKRLESHFREDDLIVRLERDRFAVIQKGVSSDEGERFGNTLLSVFDTPIYLGHFGTEQNVTASVGLSFFPDDSRDASGLFFSAEQNVRRVKTQGRNGFASVGAVRYGKDSLVNELKLQLVKAVHWENFKIFYEPRYDLSSGAQVGVEAQLSWRSSRGWLTSQEFRSELIATGDMPALERSLLEHICVETCKTNVNVSVDISSVHFLQTDFVPSLRQLLSQTGLSPSRLTLEIDFAAIKSNRQAASDAIRILNDLGIKLMLDGFGLAFVPNADLGALPLAGVKLHPKLLHDLRNPRRSDAAATMLAMLIEQAHEFGLSVTALGVEDEVQRTILKGMRCNYGQGEVWGSPLPSISNRATPLGRL